VSGSRAALRAGLIGGVAIGLAVVAQQTKTRSLEQTVETGAVVLSRFATLILILMRHPQQGRHHISIPVDLKFIDGRDQEA